MANNLEQICVYLEINYMVKDIKKNNINSNFLNLEKGTVVKNVTHRLGLSNSQVTVVVNGQIAKENTQLFDGDRVVILPQLSGG